jgi:hypothetical protein
MERHCGAARREVTVPQRAGGDAESVIVRCIGLSKLDAKMEL